MAGLKKISTKRKAASEDRRYFGSRGSTSKKKIAKRSSKSLVVKIIILFVYICVRSRHSIMTDLSSYFLYRTQIVDTSAYPQQHKKDTIIHRQMQLSSNRTAHDVNTNIQFSPSFQNGTWILPDTPFTPYLSTLVDYYKQNYQKCKKRSYKNRKGGIHIKVATNKNGIAKVKSIGKPVLNKVNLSKWIQQLLRSKQHTLPLGKKIYISFSKGDKDVNTTCQFANSAPPNRQHSVFNFQDIRHMHEGKTYPEALPWVERHTIPVFRGSSWGISKALVSKMELEGKTNIVEEVGRNNSQYQRAPLVKFSNQYPDLVNAKFTQGKLVEDKHSIWVNNRTNGLDQVLPFDSIPEDKYYTEYQTHIVMGGVGAAFRTARIMNQGIAVVLQDYPYEEWFTHLMVPYEHYIPLNQNISNLNETLHWIQDHPGKVHEIAKNGKIFYEKYLAYDKMNEFYYELMFRLLLCCG